MKLGLAILLLTQGLGLTLMGWALSRAEESGVVRSGGVGMESTDLSTGEVITHTQAPGQVPGVTSGSPPLWGPPDGSGRPDWNAPFPEPSPSPDLQEAPENAILEPDETATAQAPPAPSPSPLPSPGFTPPDYSLR